MAAFVFLASVLLVLPSLAPRTVFERLAATRNSFGSLNLASRAEIYAAGIDLFLEHPVLGAGSGAFRPAAQESQSPHSSFLALLAEQGIIGFGIFSVVMVMAILYGRRQPQLLAWLWLAILFIWIIHSSVHEFLHLKQPWVFLSLVIVGAGLKEERVRSAVGRSRSASHVRLGDHSYARQILPGPDSSTS